jgi:RoxA-like, cytochrome c-like
MLRDKEPLSQTGRRLAFVLQVVTLLSGAIAIPLQAEDTTIAQPIANGDTQSDERSNFVVSSPQRTGDPSAGREYLIQGNYLASGVPAELVKRVYLNRAPNHLQREGDSAVVPFDYNLITSSSGNPIVVPNCLQCHAQEIDGKFIMGVGNTFVDFARDLGPTAAAIDLVLAATYGSDSAQRKDYQRFKTSITAVAPYIKTKVRGTHSADKLAFVLAVHRDARDLRWHAPLEIPEALQGEAIPTDVPPWWVLKKKHAMFYAGTGRGDFARIMMASSLVTMQDATEASEIDRHFVDVLAYLKTIEPPPYPKPIDAKLAATGRSIFEDHCARCHGTYGEDQQYPNLLISVDEVGTDPLLAKANGTKYRSYFEGYRDSWFATPPHAAKLVVTDGYIAPPLDGIWITAPYLHNGSVPDLMTLLESPRRPRRWRRSFRSDDYDYETIGWRYEDIDSSTKDSSAVYDTTRDGYGNQGHRFGDALNAEDRKAVVEFLKTL